MAQMPEPVFRQLCDLMVDYTNGVDAIAEPEKVVDLFTDDVVIDFSDVQFPKMEGKDAVRAFYTGLTENMAHEFHMPANFRAESWDGEVGVLTAYVMGMGRAKDGTAIDVQVVYRMECVEVAGAWKCRHFSLKCMMPIGG